MMKKSAGILAFRFKEDLQVFLVHPGGPFFKNKDAGVWTIPKGELMEDEDPLDAARREFLEETGHELSGKLIKLSPVKQKGGKVVLAWAIEKDFDENNITSNTFQIEWPPKSGKMSTFPEIDKAAWFSVGEAKGKINPAQVAFIDEVYCLNK
ncbi:MAG TPA: NUDIX domain-containing protein [Segetibacter sp.]